MTKKFSLRQIVIDDVWELTRLPHYVLSDVPDLKSATQYEPSKSLDTPVSGDFVLCVGVLCLSDAKNKDTFC